MATPPFHYEPMFQKGPDTTEYYLLTKDYVSVSDEEAMEAFFLLCRNEGIIPAIESSHALAYAIKYAKEHKTGTILVNLSGRGDKDIDYIYENYGYGERFNLD